MLQYNVCSHHTLISYFFSYSLLFIFPLFLPFLLYFSFIFTALFISCNISPCLVFSLKLYSVFYHSQYKLTYSTVDISPQLI